VNLTQIHFPNKLARMEYPDDEEAVASTQGPLEGVTRVLVLACTCTPDLGVAFVAYRAETT
jgi:hypothetical protein